MQIKNDLMLFGGRVRKIFKGKNSDADLLNKILKESNYIDAISLLDSEFNLVDSTIDTKVEQIANFKTLLKNNSDGEYCFAIDFQSPSKTLYICNGIFENNNLIGYLVEQVSEKFTDELCKGLKLQEDSIFYLLDENNRFITSGTAYSVMGVESRLSSNNKAGLEKVIDLKTNQGIQSGLIKYKIKQSEYVGYLSNSKETGYTLAVVTDTNQYETGSVLIILLVAFTIILLVLFVIFMKTFVPKNISEPIERVIYTLDRVRKEHNYSLRVEKQNDDEIGKMTDAVNNLLEYIENIDNQVVNKQKNLTKKATNDPLTGIRNKGAMEESAERMIKMANANGKNIVVGFVDIDNFRDYNTKYGHQMGDRVIQYIADTLNNTIDGLVGRVGGDEFMFCDINTSIESVEAQLKRLYKKLVKGIYHDEIGENVVVTCSIGVVFADEEREEVTLKVLTKSADKAMYQAKNSGKNQYSIVRYGEK